MSADDALVAGHWVQRGLIRIWQPLGGPSPTLLRDRHHRLLEERYFRNEWWARPAQADDPQVTRRRLAELVSEFDSHDARIPTEEVA